MKIMDAIGNNRPGERDMLGIVAQQESKGHGDSTTVPLDVYGVGVTEGATVDVASSVCCGPPGVTAPVGTGVVPAAEVGVAGARAAASAAVLGIPAWIHAW